MERLLFLAYDEVVELEMDRQFLAVQDGKYQECAVERWYRDALEEGQALLAA